MNRSAINSEAYNYHLYYLFCLKLLYNPKGKAIFRIHCFVVASFAFLTQDNRNRDTLYMYL